MQNYLLPDQNYQYYKKN